MKEIVNDGFAKVVKPYMDAQDKKSREIIAPVEVSPAEAPHSVGDQIIYNGLLYDVTAPIEVEDSLETSGAGANISPADNIEAQIKATKSQIQAAAAQAAAQNKKTQKMLAPVEEDETDASRAYVIGEQLILDGILYNVIDPIAQHGIITAEGAGANIEEADDVTTQLSSLNQTLTNEIDKAYQTDDAAITEVASDDLLPIYDTSATAKKKIAINNFIGGLVSNPNLLDNPWFTVNQRGQNSYSGNVYGPDRWLFHEGQTVTVSDNGITLDTDADFWQRFGTNTDFFTGLIGKPITISVLTSTGIIYSGSAIVNSTGLTQCITGDKIIAFVGRDQYFDYIGIRAMDTSITIRAVKLELGSVSTLAQDTPPNYATELLKCQRYFVAIPISESIARINANITAIRVQGIYTNNLRSPVSSVTTSATGINVSGNGMQVNLAYESDFTLAFESGQGVKLSLTTEGQAKLSNMGNQLVGLWDYQNKIYVSADL